jgi:hypothetical protein
VRDFFTKNERKWWWAALVGMLFFQYAYDPPEWNAPAWFYIACLVGISIALGVIFWSHARFMRRIGRIYDERDAFAVLGEVEGYVEAAFVTPDRQVAHDVYEAAAKAEDARDPRARITLINCVLTKDAFLERLEESP